MRCAGAGAHGAPDPGTNPATDPRPREHPRAGRCRICGGAVAFALSAQDPARRAGPSFDYVECVACGALQLDVVPLDPAAAYPDAYYTGHQRVRVPRAGGRFGWRRGLARLRLCLPSGAVARALSGRRFGRYEWFRRTGTGLDDPILDVGCGSGRLLFRLHGEGFRDLVGIDPRLLPEALARAAGRPGLRLENATPESHCGRYRLVMAHHAFEHMADPVGGFEAMAERVAPGGSLLLRVPRADSWARAHYGADWAQLDAPRHLQIPTRRSIEHLARRAGLRVEHVEDDSGVFQIWGSERALPSRRMARCVAWLRARCRATRLRRTGQGDQAAFYLRRPLRHPD